MKNCCLYFQVHQPFRLNRFSFMDIGKGVPYYDETLNSEILRRISLQSYLPANTTLLKLIKAGNRQLRVNFSLSGTVLDQFEKYMPEMIDSFRALAATGCVEFTAETYAHSLAALKSSDEFNFQVRKHSAKVHSLFGETPQVFRNTTFTYNNEVANMASRMGIKALLTNSTDKENKNIHLFMNYESFGKLHGHAGTIIDFVKNLPNEILQANNQLLLPAEVQRLLPSVASIVRPRMASFPEETHTQHPWLTNDMQQDAFHTLYTLIEKVHMANDPLLIRDWLYLQSSDHFAYMGMESADNAFSPYDNAFDAFINYMNVLTDFSLRTDNLLEKKKTAIYDKYALEA